MLGSYSRVIKQTVNLFSKSLIEGSSPQFHMNEEIDPLKNIDEEISILYYFYLVLEHPQQK